VPQPDPDKAALRRAILARRDALAPAVRADANRRITAHLLAHAPLAAARSVLAYLSFGSEIDTRPLLAALQARGAAIVLPRVHRAARRLDLYRVSDLDADTLAGVWGIREPDPARCALADLQEIDAVLAPGVAFTRAGGRLGYGGGFYDRLLGRWPARPPVIAAAYDAQIVDAMPIEPTDVPVDAVVTESGPL
jgi:5-formyltetrahydrofolate cyclo-ligase